MKVLLDTSVIVRFCQTADVKHHLVLDAVARLSELGHQTCIVPQVVYELWSVATRPINANGLGWTTEEAKNEVERLGKMFVFLKDERTVYSHWIELVSRFAISGRNSHDARLIAAMDRHAISHILTLDCDDFRKFSHKTIWFPKTFLRWCRESSDR